ncbi:MAG: hypothetical protein JW866_01270 [Ignavibacteriales bacterium]|nr:hypothetical protein [Ignavibacteriales bacterium]
MKKLVLIAAVILLSAFSLRAEISRPMHGVNFNYFYHSLSPYGEWIAIDYDVYVWRPYGRVTTWSPYYDGRWSYTSYGWYWESYEPFGWAVYHYGRWYYDNYYGWIWIPDYEWGPSWVEWRYNDTYIGWAPLPPYASFRINVGIYFSVNWYSNYNYWKFVRHTHFCHSHVYHHYVAYNHVNYIFNTTKYRTNYGYSNGRVVNYGVDRSYIEKRGNYKIREREVVETSKYRDYSSNRNLSNDRVEMYRPTDTEVNKYRDFNRDEIKTSDRKTDLQTDKIVVNTRTNSRDYTINEKNDVYTSNRDVDVNRYDNKTEDVKTTNRNTDIKKEDNTKTTTNRDVNKNYYNTEDTKSKNTNTNTFNRNDDVYKNSYNTDRKTENTTNRDNSKDYNTKTTDVKKNYEIRTDVNTKTTTTRDYNTNYSNNNTTKNTEVKKNNYNTKTQNIKTETKKNTTTYEKKDVNKNTNTKTTVTKNNTSNNNRNNTQSNNTVTKKR